MRRNRRSPSFRGAARVGEAFLVGIGVGLGLMYLADPAMGGLRRTLLRLKTGRWRRQGRETLGDLRQRIQSISARFRARFGDEPVPDATLVERVRNEMGHYVALPHAIEISAKDGVVTVSGPILPNEVEALICRMKKVHGVDELEDDLEIYETGDVPVLQGGFEAPGRLERFLQRDGPPAVRIATAATGIGLWVYGFRRPSVTGYAVGTLGALLLGGALVESRRRRRFTTLSARPSEAARPSSTRSASAEHVSPF